MTATIDLFRSLAKTLDAVVIKVDKDLPMAEDIHPAIHRVGEYAADMVRLPAALAKLEARKVSVEASVPAREKSVRAARHAVVTLEAKLKKLGERIVRNRSVLTDEDEAPVAQTSAPIDGLALPTRKEIIEGLRKEFLAAEDEIAKARDTLKRAEAFRKGIATRAANLATEIEAARKAVVDHAGRLEETVKILRKTITHLTNRQEKRDRKREAHAAIPVTVADEAPKAPTDEDIRKKAESMGLAINGPEDLEAARQLFLN